MINIFLPFFLLFITLSPVAINLGSQDGKPIDIVIGVIFSVFGVFLIFNRWLYRQKIYRQYISLVFITLFIFLFSILYAGIEIGFSYTNILSFVKFIYPVFSFGFFFYIFRHCNSIYPLFFAILLIGLILLLSEFINSTRFPLPRWGEYFFYFETYGHPNSFGSMVVLYLTISLIVYRHVKPQLKIYAFMAIVYFSLLGIMLSSRNAFLSMALLFTFFIFYRPSILKLALFSIMASLIFLLDLLDFSHLFFKFD